jgi:hypothetical protein
VSSVLASRGESDALDRAWCLWELSLRAHAKKKSLIMGKLNKKASSCCMYIRTESKPVRLNAIRQEVGYDFLSKMQIFDEQDRKSIVFGLKLIHYGDIERINKAIALQVLLFKLCVS